MSPETTDQLKTFLGYAVLLCLAGWGGFNVFRAQWLQDRRLRYAAKKFGRDSLVYRSTRNCGSGYNLLTARLVSGLVALFAIAAFVLFLSQDFARR